MTNLYQRFLFAGILTVIFAASESAQAQIFAPFYGYAGGTGPFNLYSDERVPYYALYPPVYYSHAVPRPYGWSPFAYPPGVQTPSTLACPPLEVQNPHVNKKTPAKPMADRTAIAPLVIENPFVTDASPASPQTASKTELSRVDN